MPVLFPHDFVQWAHSSHNHCYELWRSGHHTEQGVIDFWESLQDDDPVWRRLGRHAEDLGCCFPLYLHADKVPVTKEASGIGVVVTSVIPILSQFGLTIDKHVMYAAYPDSIMLKQKTPVRRNITGHPLAVALNWSLDVLEEGVSSPVDWNGDVMDSTEDAIAGGDKFFCMRMSADLEHYELDLELQHHAGGNRVCFKCIADRSDNPWTDFRPGAAYKSSCYDATTWPMQSHPLFARNHDPFVASVDWSHCMEKGVTGHAMGSFFKELIWGKQLVPGGSLDAQVIELNALKGDFYERNQTPDRANYIALSNIANVKAPHQEYPFLNLGNFAKIRCLTPFAVELSIAHNSGSPRDVHRQELFHALDELYACVLGYGVTLSADELGHFTQTADALLMHYSWLAKHYEPDALPKLYNTVYKHHYVWHIAQEARFLNPRVTWTLSGEDFVGQIARITKGCTRGKPHKAVPRSLFDKYVSGMALRWEEYESFNR